MVEMWIDIIKVRKIQLEGNFHSVPVIWKCIDLTGLFYHYLVTFNVVRDFLLQFRCLFDDKYFNNDDPLTLTSARFSYLEP